HLITSLATPLSSKLDEWRRTLVQLEKDRARQTKRARADLKRAVSEANRWKKKAAKCGSTVDLGPGIGHGILPSTNSSAGTRASMVAAQMANALHEVQLKTEQVEAAEQSAVRGFMLEERGRFCFFLSCLLPILECQQSMLSELSTIDELVQSLTKAIKNPEQLMEDAESVLFRASRGELSRSSNVKSWYDSDNSSGLIAAATAALFANHDHMRAGSSDTDSGRLTMDANPLERKPDDQLDNCSLSSSTQSQLNADGVGTYHDSNLPGHGNHNSNYRYLSVGDGTSLSLGGVSSHSSSESSGGNPGYGSTRISLGVHVMPGLTEPQNAFGGSVPFRQFDSTLGYTKSGLGPTHSAGDNPLATSCLLPTTTAHQVDMDESQFRTLCRPGHCRTSSANVLSTGIIMPQQSGQPDPKPHSLSTGSPLLTKSEANLIHLPNQNSRPIVDQNWLRDCDNDEEDEDDDDEEERTSSAEDGNADEGDETPDEEGGEYVEVQGELNKCTPNENGSIGALLVNETRHVGSRLSNMDAAVGLNFGRHTISSAYERGGTAGNRSSLSNLAFNPPIGKSSSKDSGVDSSTVLYPNQALPPPVYTNLNQLAHAAQRKFSIPQIPSSVTVNGSSYIPAPSSPHRTVVDDRLTPGRHPTANTTVSCSPSADRFQPNVYESSAIQSVPHNLMTLASAPALWSTGPTARRVTANSPGSSSTGIDPFSVELDELDKLGGTGHCRTSSANVLSTGIIMPQQSGQPDPKPHSLSTGSPLLTKSEANLIHLPNQNSRPIVDQNWLRDCDNDEEDEDDDDEEERTSSAEDGNADEGDEVGDVPQFDLSKPQRNQLGPNLVQTPDEEGGEYVEVQGELNKCTPNENGSTGALLVNETRHVGSRLSNMDAAVGLNFGRHTISSAYERGGTAGNRSSLSNLAFNPPIGKSSSKDSGVDSSTVLYPNQALPPPVYTNLNQLAHAAQRKFSIPQIPSSVTVNGSSYIPAPSSPHRTVVDDRLTPGRHPTANTTVSCSPSADRFQPNVYESSAIQSVPHNLMTLASAPALWSTGPTARRVTANSPGSSSTGIDPFSVELDELDKLGGTVNPVSRAHGSFASLPRLRSPVHHRSSLLTFPKTSTSPPSSLSSPYLSGLSPRSFNCMSLNPATHLNSGQPSFDLSLCASSSQETLSNSPKFDIQECHLKTLSLNAASLLRKNPHVLPVQANVSSVFSLQSAPEHTEPSSPLPVRPLTVSVHGSTVEHASRTSPISPTFNSHSRGPPISPKPARLRELLAGELLGTRRRTTPGRLPPPPAPIRRSSMLRSSCSSLSDLESRIPTDSRRANLRTSPVLSSCFSGSSNASSLTMASSTTSESQPSANGNRLTSVNHAGRLGYSGDVQLPSEDANRLPVATTAGPVPTVGKTMAYQLATRPSSVVQTGAITFPSSAPTTVSWYADAGSSQTAGPFVSSEAASLMSELSSQLQQLATRTVSDSVPTRPVGIVSQPSHADDEFDLPPPPPDSMFNTDTVLSDQSMTAHHTALLSALIHSVFDGESRSTLLEDSTTSRPS
ncbi:hypothetical protein AHF37_03337, partial [Paragonimus kellicotti]